MSGADDQNVDPGHQVADREWRTLYIIGGVAALTAVLLFRRNMSAELMGFSGFGIVDVPAAHPSTAIEWFELFQRDRLLGLALLDVIDLVNYALVGLIFLALYGALHRVNRGAMAIAITFGLVGIAVYLASNQTFSMASLSDRYADATTEAQSRMYLAGGEALLAIHNPGAIQQGTGIHASLFLVLLSGLISSAVMLRSSVFSRTAAYVGILANGFGLAYFIALAIAPALYVLPPVISAPFRVVWYVLIALALFRLARRRPDEKGTGFDN